MLKKDDERIREAQGQKSRQTARLNTMHVFIALLNKPLTFSELIKETGFSKPVLTKHLKTLMKKDAIYKDTIKPHETTNATKVGKIVYKYISKDIIPDIASVIETMLQMPKPNWSEQSKAELKRHCEEIAKILLEEELDKSRMNEHTKK